MRDTAVWALSKVLGALPARLTYSLSREQGMQPPAGLLLLLY